MLNNEQINQLSNLFLDLAKGILLAAFIAPATSTALEIFSLVRLYVLGVAFVVVSLGLVKNKGVSV